MLIDKTYEFKFYRDLNNLNQIFFIFLMNKAKIHAQ